MSCWTQITYIRLSVTKVYSWTLVFFFWRGSATSADATVNLRRHDLGMKLRKYYHGSRRRRVDSEAADRRSTADYSSIINTDEDETKADSVMR